jgi:hypothetical protein
MRRACQKFHGANSIDFPYTRGYLYNTPSSNGPTPIPRFPTRRVLSSRRLSAGASGIQPDASRSQSERSRALIVAGAPRTTAIRCQATATPTSAAATESLADAIATRMRPSGPGGAASRSPVGAIPGRAWAIIALLMKSACGHPIYIEGVCRQPRTICHTGVFSGVDSVMLRVVRAKSRSVVTAAH